MSRDDCYVENRFDSHTLSPLSVPLLAAAPQPFPATVNTPTKDESAPAIETETSHLFWELEALLE